MLDSIQACSYQFFPILQEKITHSLSDSQKRIMLIASAALAFLAACYLAKSCFDRFSRSDIKPVKDENDQNQPNPVDPSKVEPLDESHTYTPLEVAFELMFENRTLITHASFSKIYSDEELKDRHEKLKKLIAELPEKDINTGIIYRDGMAPRTQSLLLQAIMHISDSDRRLEIVKILLDKGADPTLEGFYYKDVKPIKEAKKINDEKLIQLLEDAIKKQEQKVAE